MKLTVNTRANTIRFDLDTTGAPILRRTLPAVLDVGAGGRLIGIEVELAGAAAPAPDEPAATIDPATDSLYIAIEEHTDRHLRSAQVTVELATDAAGRIAALTIPRRGAGYEITYPSGNR